MIDTLSVVTVLVRDQDEALEWYTEKLRFEKRSDDTFGPDARWVTVAPENQDEIEIVLQKPDPAVHGEERATEMREQIGQGTTWSFDTDDFETTHEQLRSRGVSFVTEPAQQPYGTEAVFEDLYGNRFNLLEPQSAPEA